MSNNNFHDCKGVPLFHLIYSTGLGTGFLPLMPGTWGALLALAIWYVLYLTIASPLTLFLVTLAMILVVTVTGAWTSHVMEGYWGEDPRTVNIDEFVGTWIPLLIAPCGRWTWVLAILGFALFRIIDMVKPFGCRRMESVPNGWGVMLDDVLAGFYALVIVAVVKFFIVGCDFVALF